MSKRPRTREADPSVRELIEIKKLLILDLLSRDVKPGQIAKILGVDAGNFSRLYPTRKIMGSPKKTK
jgi:hypothetical protein